MTRYYPSSIHTRRLISVSKHLFKIFILLFLAPAVLLLSSCEKGITSIGGKLLPESDFVTIKSIDTLSIFSYTMYNKSVRSDNPGISFIGDVYDPYFGTTTAGFVSEIRLKPEWDGKPYTLDSVKLFLKLLNVKGKSNEPHILRLSEISEQIYNDSTYYSDKSVPLVQSEYWDVVLPKLKPDTINRVEIKFPDVSFAERLTRDTAQLFYNNSKPDFRAYFKGLNFELIPETEPLLVSLSLIPDNTGYYNNYFVIYLHDDSASAKEYAFVLDAKNKNAAFNKFSHVFTSATMGGGNLNNVINKESKPSVNDTLSYLQSLDGVYSKLVFPGLEIIKNNPDFKSIAVNKSRLTIPAYLDGTIYNKSNVPSTLRLRYKTKSGVKNEVPDFLIGYSSSYDYSSFFDGSLDTAANVYNFNIPAFVQKYLDDETGEILPELEVYQKSGSRNVILKANKSKTPVKFQFTYTKF